MDRAAVSAIAALEDDVRRALYEHVRAAGAPVTREGAAAAVGISRNLAAFHLDKLVDLGLLHSSFGPPTRRRVGRAPRVYEPAPGEISVCLPQRRPELLAEILMAAVLSAAPDEAPPAAAERLAAERGARAGAQERSELRGGRLGTERALAASAGALARHGYEPYPAGPSTLRLRNCPFDALAAQEPAFTCGLNQAYLRGFLTGLGAGERIEAELAPRPGECCVELRAAARPSA